VSFIPFDSPANRHSPQLVVTLGPASLDAVEALAAAGATGFRLNASHMVAAVLADALLRIRASCPEAPLVVDLQGAKMRVECDRPLDVAAGDAATLTRQGGGLRVPHAEFFQQVQAGDTVSFDDGKLRMAVERIEGEQAHVRALNPGRFLSRKGVNVEQHPVQLTQLTARDVDACRAAAGQRVSSLAYSFMTDGREAAWVRSLVPGCTVVGKVERREAAASLGAIADAVDAVWICRGDLGVQLGPAELGRFVRAIDPQKWRAPVLMAGQVLEHLTSHPEPTRSEVCHLYDLVDRGFAGIVLSDETAIGRDAVHATTVAAALLASFRR
jgi:pyruvate kinase